MPTLFSSTPVTTRITATRFTQLLVLLFSVLALSGCLGLSVSKDKAQTVDNPISKSPNDVRDYLAFELENRLQVLVISDPEADKAAAALSVAVGSGSDPKEREGLAHFLEHMLFLGTEKYPEAGAYQRFISEHGGSHNAYTAFDETNYFFDVNADALEPTLDQFAQFFIAPLFNAEYVEREKHAVHSEYQAKIKDDSRLQYDVLKAVSNPAHPFSKFSVGSLETLADRPNQPVRKDLLAFYQQHYSTNLMTLVVLGKQPVAELRQLVTQKFAAVTDRNSLRPTFKQPLFTEQQLPLRVNTVPNKNLRRVIYHFPVPSTRAHLQTKPVNYLSNLLGHEGEGSLLSYLKQRGWADSLSAGIGFETDQQASVQVVIGLTAEGLKHTEAVSMALFQAIALIKQEGVENWRYQEQAQLAKLDFRFQENGNNMHYVTSLASRLQHVPVPQLLTAPYQMSDYNAQLIDNYLAALQPDNMLMMVVGKTSTSEHKTQHFNAPYTKLAIENHLQQHWQNPGINPDISLPAANPFIPTRLDLIQSPDLPAGKPEKSLSLSSVPYWHSIDTSFKTPKADFYFTLRSPLANQTAENVALMALYVKTINEQLNEFSYPAALAGLSYRLYPHVRGVSVRLSGYQDKQPLLLEEILEALRRPLFKPETFSRHKDELLRSWQNVAKQKPYQQSLGHTSRLVTEPGWSEQQLIAALVPLTRADLQQFSEQFLQQLDIEVLGNGNLSSAAMADRVRQVQSKLITKTRPEVSKPQLIKLPKQQKLLHQFAVEHSDNAVTLYVQGENKNISSRARFALLNQMLATPFYHELRTRQQLGYIVFSSPMTLLEVPALAFTVQSPSSAAADIVNAIETFIAGFSNTLTSMDAATLATHKKALIGRLLEKDSRLNQRSNRYWREIDRSNFDFDTREQLVAAIESIELSDLQNAYQQDFVKQPRQLVSMAVGSGNNSSGKSAEIKLPGYRPIEANALTEFVE